MTIYTIETATKNPADPHTIGYFTDHTSATLALERAREVYPDAFMWEYPANMLMGGIDIQYHPD